VRETTKWTSKAKCREALNPYEEDIYPTPCLALPCLEHVREMALMTPDLRGEYNFSRLRKAARMYQSPLALKNCIYGSCKIFFSFLFLEGFEVGLEGSKVQTED